MAKLRTLALVAMCAVLLTGVVASAQEPVEITFWHHWSANRLEMVDKMVADFEALYPWIKVNHVFSSTVGAADRMGTLIVSGVAPEVMMVRGTYAHQLMSNGGFLPLDDLIARDGIDLDMFVPGDLRSFQFMGSTYALPAMSGSAWTNLMFYNKDILNNSGVDPDQPPKTWSEWRQAARMATRMAGDGVVIQGGSAIPPFSHAAAWNGSLFWSDDWKTANVNNPDTLEALDFITSFVEDIYGSYGNYHSFYNPESFWSGLSGFNFTNNSGFGLAKEVDFEWGAALAPVNDQNPNARPTGLVSSTWAYGIPASISDEKLEAAWLFLQYVTIVEDGGGWFSRVQGRPSPVIEFNTHSDYRYENPYWHVVIEALGHDVAAPPVNALAIVDAAGAEAIVGTKHPVQALSDGDIRLQQALDEYWETIGQ